jgi:ribose transport system substrate-binding protein
MKYFAFRLAAISVLLGCSTVFADPKKITIGIVAKSQSNPVFQAAHKGAQDAAKELGPKYGVEVTINIQTPPQEDAVKAAEAVEQLGRSGADGIAVSCSDANALAPAIDKAIAAGAQVMCFDSDAPKSKRFAYYGTDDVSCGKRIIDELGPIMDGKGTIAVLAGNQAAPNLRNRVKGLKDELATKFPDMKILDVYYNAETPEQAAAEVQREQSAHPEIQGWAMIGGWPLFTRDALKWDIKDGHVQVLLAQDCYGWGYKSVQILLDKIVKNQDPPSVKVIDPLTKVTKDSVEEFGKNWDKWLGK